MNVLLIGAFGIVGSAITDHLQEEKAYEFTLLDRNIPEGESGVAGDVTNFQSIRGAFDNQDAVIYAALPPGLSSDDQTIGWSAALDAHLRGFTNVMQAAVEANVERIIFASSNHAVGQFELDRAPDIYSQDHTYSIDHTVEAKPDSMYGVSKLYGEALCRLCASIHDIRCYALRIGSVRKESEDHPYSDALSGGRPDAPGETPSVDSSEYEQLVNRMKGLWLSRRDCAQLVECCLQNESVQFGIYYGVSDNDRRWYSLRNAREDLGYAPMDNAEEWTAPPEG